MGELVTTSLEVLRKIFLKKSCGHLLVGSVLLIFTMGCATGHCRGRKENPDKKIFIFKSDGSKQCAQEPGIALDAMGEELKEIKVFSKEKRHDGRMYPMVCGGKTGKVNVYEINESDLTAAKALKFEVLEGDKGTK